MRFSTFVNKMLKVSATFSGSKGKAPLCFKEYGVDLLFRPTLAIKRTVSQVFDKPVIFFRIIHSIIFFGLFTFHFLKFGIFHKF